jgi:hypothetical protein
MIKFGRAVCSGRWFVMIGHMRAIFWYIEYFFIAPLGHSLSTDDIEGVSAHTQVNDSHSCRRQCSFSSADGTSWIPASYVSVFHCSSGSYVTLQQPANLTTWNQGLPEVVRLHADRGATTRKLKYRICVLTREVLLNTWPTHHVELAHSLGEVCDNSDGIQVELYRVIPKTT